VEPLVAATAEECRAKLPSTNELRWTDTHLWLHNCVSFLCELLLQLTASYRLPTGAVIAVFNDAFCLLVEVACQSATDVSAAAEALHTWLTNGGIIGQRAN